MAPPSRDDLIDEVMELRRDAELSRRAIDEACELLSKMRKSYIDEGRIDPVLDLLDTETYDFLRKYGVEYAPDE